MGHSTSQVNVLDPQIKASGKPTVFGKHGCMFCGSEDLHSVVDLGMSPMCESYVKESKYNEMEPFYPLHMFVCGSCFLAQIDRYVSPADIFTEYAYFSSYSDSWVTHMKRYAEAVVDRFALDRRSLVIEVGSNDGYLLQHFMSLGVPVLGIEPAANVAEVADERGVPTWVKFFGVKTAELIAAEGKQADLIAGANVLAQVPDVNDFVAGLKIALKSGGVITIEFPHLSRLIGETQFDTIYHEHFSYFSLFSVEAIFAAHGLKIFDVDELSTHGGSLRIYACHAGDRSKVGTSALSRLRDRERLDGVHLLSYYSDFTERVRESKRALLEFLIKAKRDGKSVAGYGAPGKGNTLLNYCGIRADFLDYTVDRNPYKQGKFLPGTRIPILHPGRLRETRPDYVLILPWNLQDEIVAQLEYVREWGGQFVVPIPTTRIV